MKPQELLFQWLDHRLAPDVSAWLRAQCALLADGAPDRVLHLAFGLAVRKTGHAPLAASPAEQAAAFAFHPGWDLRDWTLDQAARAALLLSLPHSEKSASEKNARAVLALFQTADLGEHVALVRALFLLPNARELLHIAREAIRSNMGDVFFAISQRNPYPAEHFDEIAWNQMVTKCIFTDLPLRDIHGIDARANAALARMITGLAQERWAAGRAISPEAWRCVAAYPEEEGMTVLEDALGKTPAVNTPEGRGAVLALWNTADGSARALARSLVKAKAPELVPALESGTLTWDNYDQL